MFVLLQSLCNCTVLFKYGYFFGDNGNPGHVANNLNASNVTIWKQFIQTCLYPDGTFPQRNAWLPGLFSIFLEHILFKCTLQNYISLIFRHTVFFLVVFSCQAHSSLATSLHTQVIKFFLLPTSNRVSRRPRVGFFLI